MTVADRSSDHPRVAALHFPSSSEEGNLRALHVQRLELRFRGNGTKSLGESIRITAAH